MVFLQQLQQIPASQLAMDGSEPKSYQQLRAKAEQIRQHYPQLAGQAIALHYTGLAEFISALLAFDGWCSALYLLPETDISIADEVYVWPADGSKAPTAAVAASSPEAVLESVQETVQQTVWYLATSGTTGTPKWIAHSFTGLSRAIKCKAAQQPLRWGLCYQPYRFAGLQVLLQSVLSGACLVDASQGDAGARIQVLQQYQVNALSATPSLWRQLLMTNQLSAVPLQQLTLGGEIADQPLLTQLQQLFPSARLLHIYASTEAGVGFAVSDGKAGFPAAWLNQSHSQVQLRINAEQHLCIKPPVIPLEQTAVTVDQHGFIDTTDVVELREARVLFLGRASGAINVGGNKVHPEQVEQVLLQHDAVLQAKVYGKASSVLGQLVVADIAVAPDTDTKALQADLMQLCFKQLQRHQIPTRYYWLSQLSNSNTGKLSRKESNV
ncbi:MAG: AMP-binding protein [Alkalimonas sp.]|nr:AMP-binding protein [Alkalimonas sp.]